MYTDGLIERRGESIDDGDRPLGTHDERDAERDRPDGGGGDDRRAIGAPSDDVALLLVDIDGASGSRSSCPPNPGSLPGIRRRLRAWLDAARPRRRASREIVLAVSEACNNAIEHGYRDGPGSVVLRGEYGRGGCGSRSRTPAPGGSRRGRRARARAHDDEDASWTRSRSRRRPRNAGSPSSTWRGRPGRSRSPNRRPRALVPRRRRRQNDQALFNSSSKLPRR